MITLAAFRYRHVLAENGGPVAKLETGETSVLGQRRFLANATLAPRCRRLEQSHFIYGNCDGTGVDESPMVARFKAISESLERWAHATLARTPEGRHYGFEVDPSSTGMAAFPGLLARQARRAALTEAVERFNLLNWWEGRLPAIERETRWPGVRAAVVCSEAPGIMVILFRRAESGLYSYGHAAAATFEAACEKAALEMERHRFVVHRFALAHAGERHRSLPDDSHAIERRAWFFAQHEGHELFLGRLRSAATPLAGRPRVVFDGAIPGPWSRYASVWRVCYEPPSRRFLSSDTSYFFW